MKAKFNIRNSIFTVLILCVFALPACTFFAPKHELLNDGFYNYGNYIFEDDYEGFEAVFSGYHDDESSLASYNMQHKHDRIDYATESESGKGLYIASNNLNGDMFMGFYKKLSGFEAETLYSFRVKFTIATNMPKGRMGVGSSPDSSVLIKGGFAPQKPVLAKDENGVFCFENVSIGNQSNGGTHSVVLGNIEKTSDSTDGFEQKTFYLNVDAVSNNRGVIYLILGSYSGFEGFTEYYLDEISVKYQKEGAGLGR